MKHRNHKIYFGILFIYFLIVIGTFIFGQFFSLVSVDIKTNSFHRHILSISNCTPRSVEQFPVDFMTRKEKLQGGVIFHIAISIYLFMSLAIICDDYFVSSLERICEVLHIKHDVAGATFMAAGSSAPELFTSIIGVFITNTDVGVSTIVGSAVFNILCIIALSGLFAGILIELTPWPLIRDCVIYSLSVIALIIIIQDGLVHWYEAFIMIIMYILYIVLFYFNDKLEEFFSKFIKSPILNKKSEYAPILSVKETAFLSAYGSSDDEEVMETGDVDSNHSRIHLTDDNTSLNGESISPFEIPDSFIHRLYWVAMLPVKVFCYLTIPDCRKPGYWRKLFFLTFLLSIIWLAVVTYVLVWMVSITGDTLGIPDTVMGLTLLAAGTSIPDAISSVIVARDGYGDMAVSNSIGSNIFDVLLCLGLPWLIKTGLIFPGSVIQISSSGLLYTSITLLSTVLILIVAIIINKWTLDKRLGLVFLLIYVIVVTFSCLNELSVFGNVAMPPCQRTRL